MSTELERKIKALENQIPSSPCRHPLPVLINPKKAEEAEMEEALDASLKSSIPGPRTRMLVIIYQAPKNGYDRGLGAFGSDCTPKAASQVYQDGKNHEGLT